MRSTLYFWSLRQIAFFSSCNASVAVMVIHPYTYICQVMQANFLYLETHRPFSPLGGNHMPGCHVIAPVSQSDSALFIPLHRPSFVSLAFVIIFSPRLVTGRFCFCNIMKPVVNTCYNAIIMCTRDTCVQQYHIWKKMFVAIKFLEIYIGNADR